MIPQKGTNKTYPGFAPWATVHRLCEIKRSANAILRLLSFSIVVVHAPAQIADRCFVDRTRHLGKICRDMMFKALLANEAKQLLQSWNPDHSGAAKGFQGIVGELALANIPADFPVIIVGRKSHIRHRARLDPA